MQKSLIFASQMQIQNKVSSRTKNDYFFPKKIDEGTLPRILLK